MTERLNRPLWRLWSWLARAQCERGQTLGEYALVVSGIAVAIAITALMVFREEFIIGYNAMSSCLNGACP